jgi:hypothetical protein
MSAAEHLREGLPQPLAAVHHAVRPPVDPQSARTSKSRRSCVQIAAFSADHTPRPNGAALRSPAGGPPGSGIPARRGAEL